MNYSYIFRPNFYVDIQLEWDQKLLALKSYVGIKIIPHPRSIRTIEALAIKEVRKLGYKKLKHLVLFEKFGRNAYLSI